MSEAKRNVMFYFRSGLPGCDPFIMFMVVYVVICAEIYILYVLSLCLSNKCSERLFNFKLNKVHVNVFNLKMKVYR